MAFRKELTGLHFKGKEYNHYPINFDFFNRIKEIWMSMRKGSSKYRVSEKQKHEILDMYNNGLGSTILSRKYEITPIMVLEIVRQQGGKVRRKATSSKLSSEKIKQMYLSGATIEEITQKAGIKEQAVKKRLRKLGIRFPIGGRKIKLNEEFFQVWTFDMAYIFGMITSDGNIDRQRRVLTISQKEKYILVEIAKKLGVSEGNVVEKNNHYYLYLSSKRICQDLCGNGLTPNKSLTLEFPTIPKTYIGAFLRGVIDGDGWVDKSNFRVVVSTGSEKFAEGLCNAFKQLDLNARKRKDCRGYFTVTVSRKADIKRLVEIIYHNKGSLYLKRKYELMTSPVRYKTIKRTKN